MVGLRKRIPFEFVLEALFPARPRTNPMFGCTAIYVADKIVFILREKDAPAADNGVWVATTREHHDSLRRELPSIRSIGVFGTEATGWQNIPVDSPTFESEALRACELVLEHDTRIGKVPAKRKPRAPRPRRPTLKARR